MCLRFLLPFPQLYFYVWLCLLIKGEGYLVDLQCKSLKGRFVVGPFVEGTFWTLWKIYWLQWGLWLSDPR
jgi:hypothetical protein